MTPDQDPQSKPKEPIILKIIEFLKEHARVHSTFTNEMTLLEEADLITSIFSERDHAQLAMFETLCRAQYGLLMDVLSEHDIDMDALEQEIINIREQCFT